jgi:hypothetical protein
MTDALRPLSTGELVDRAFSLYRTHFALFFGIFAVPHLSVLALQCLGFVYQTPGKPTLWSVWSMGALLLGVVAAAASQAATVIAVSQVHLDRPASVMDSFSRVKSQIFGVAGLSLAIGFLVALACIALIVPGILLAVKWSLAVPAKVLEGKSVGEAMSRSSQLSKGDRDRIFLVWILFILFSLGLALVLRLPVEAAAGVKSIFALQRAAAIYRIALQVTVFISQSLVGPLATIAFSLIYYDERVRKEAFDLQLMMDTLDAPALQGVPA